MSALDEKDRTAYELTIAHHGNVVHAFSSSFVSVFALFSAGGFSAAMAVLSTDIGTRMYTIAPNYIRWIVLLFALGFLTSTVLMAIVFEYSLHRYWEYRGALIEGKSFERLDPPKVTSKLYIIAWLLLPTSVIATIVALTLSVLLVFGLEPLPRK